MKLTFIVLLFIGLAVTFSGAQLTRDEFNILSSDETYKMGNLISSDGIFI